MLTLMIVLVFLCCKYRYVCSQYNNTLIPDKFSLSFYKRGPGGYRLNKVLKYKLFLATFTEILLKYLVLAKIMNSKISF